MAPSFTKRLCMIVAIIDYRMSSNLQLHLCMPWFCLSTLIRALYLAGKEISKKGGRAGLIFPGAAIVFLPDANTPDLALAGIFMVFFWYCLSRLFLVRRGV